MDPGSRSALPRLSGTTPKVLRRLRATRASFHLLVGVDAPQPLLLDPGVKTLAEAVGPALTAFLPIGAPASLQLRGNRARDVGAIVERGQIVLVLHGDDS